MQLLIFWFDDPHMACPAGFYPTSSIDTVMAGFPFLSYLENLMEPSMLTMNISL